MSFAKTFACIVGITVTVFTYVLSVTHENAVTKWRAATKDDVTIIANEMILNGTVTTTACEMQWTIDGSHYTIIYPQSRHDTSIEIFYLDPKHEFTAKDFWKLWTNDPQNALPCIRAEKFTDAEFTGVATNNVVTRKKDGSPFYIRQTIFKEIVGIITEETDQHFWHTEASDAMQARYRDALHKIAEHIRHARHPGK